MKKICLTLIFLGSLLFSTPFAFAAKDLQNGVDHPLVERFPESYIAKYDVVEFDRYAIALSPPKKVSSKIYEADKVLNLEGKITRLVYSIDSKISNYEIYKNYLDAFEKSNAEIIYTCLEEACLEVVKNYSRFYKQSLGRAFHDKALPFYSVAKFTQADAGDIYVIVLNGNARSLNQIMIHIVETKALELGKVSTNADALLNDLDTKGKAEVYDITFDTGKADIKSESQAALTEISKVLEQRPQMKLYVVGHTDDTGSLAINKNLSDQRAKAIVNYLINTHDIKNDRLYGVGVGPFAPVASNESEQGRQKNRRVELIKQL